MHLKIRCLRPPRRRHRRVSRTPSRCPLLPERRVPRRSLVRLSVALTQTVADAMSGRISWRFCATVLNGYEKPSRAELQAKLAPWGPLSLHSTKVGRIFFTLGALRDADEPPGSLAAASAYRALGTLETVEHLFAVMLEGDYACDDAGKLQLRHGDLAMPADRSSDGPATVLEGAALAQLAQLVPLLAWSGAATAAAAFQAATAARPALTEPEPEAVGPELGPELEPVPQRGPTLSFRVDVKSGAHGGRAKSSIRRAASIAYSESVASVTGWEPRLTGFDILVFLFLSLKPNAVSHVMPCHCLSLARVTPTGLLRSGCHPLWLVCGSRPLLSVRPHSPGRLMTRPSVRERPQPHFVERRLHSLSAHASACASQMRPHPTECSSFLWAESVRLSKRHSLPPQSCDTRRVVGRLRWGSCPGCGWTVAMARGVNLPAC